MTNQPINKNTTVEREHRVDAQLRTALDQRDELSAKLARLQGVAYDRNQMAEIIGRAIIAVGSGDLKKVADEVIAAISKRAEGTINE